MNPVGQVGHQHAIGELPGRDGTVMFVDGFEDIPVAVDVQPLCGAFVGQADGFGGPVVIADSTAERRADQLTFRGVTAFRLRR